MHFIGLFFLNNNTGGVTSRNVVRYNEGVLSSGERLHDEVRRPRYRTTRKRGIITRGSIVQMLLSELPTSAGNTEAIHLLSPSDGPGSRTFWYVAGLYSRESGHPLYAHVYRMKEVGENVLFERQFTRDIECRTLFVVKLTKSVVKCLPLHNCSSFGDDGCFINEENSTFSHCEDTSTGIWTIIGTKEGFPPRGQ